MDLRANTAVDVLIGPFVDKTDGNTTEDALTLTQAEIKLSKLGQPLAQKNDATSAAFDDDGYYNCKLNATDTNAEGNLVLIVHQSANALPVRHEFNVMAEAAWDSLYAAKDAGFMDVNVKTIGRTDTQETEADNLESACSSWSTERGLSGTALPGAVADAVGGLAISDAGGLDLDAMNTAAVRLTAARATLIDGITAARMAALTDWINGGRLDILLDALQTDLDNGTDGLGALKSAIGLISSTSGSGADNVTINIKQGGSPVADADVWITNDSAGNNVVAGTLQTDSSGNVLFLLDNGVTYYLWMQKDGSNSIKGDVFVAATD